MTTFLIIFILTTFITREVKVVDQKVKAFGEDCAITASKLERLRRQQQQAGTLLRKSKLLAQSYTNAVFLVILIKILVFLWGLFHGDEVAMVKALHSNVICQVLTVIWMRKSTIKANDQEFHDVTKTADTIKQQTEVTESEVQNLRWRHFQVTELLQTANSIIQPNVLLLYIIMLPSICLTVYGVVYSTLGLFDVMILASLLITNTIAVCLITATGAIINSKAHSVLQSLLELSVKSLSTDAKYQLQMFITQVTSQTIGIDIYGMFIMDGSTFLMIAGTLITYIVVVLQIQAGSCDVTNVRNCNCTT
uniref:Uncharacterized protein n=1 Tax=Magallana gigas TaxID=29159 RepID=K1Q828_MAGGI